MKESSKFIVGLLVVLVSTVATTMLYHMLHSDSNGKVYRLQTVVQTPSAGVTIPMNTDYSVSMIRIELTATPDEFIDYFKNVLAKDTINLIRVSGKRMENGRIKWAIVYNNYKPIQTKNKSLGKKAFASD